MKIYRALSAAAIMFIVGASTLFAQEKMEARDGFEKGFRAVQFGIGSNFTLTSFGDASFSFVKFRNDKKANYIRGFFINQLRVRSDESENTQTVQDVVADRDFYEYDEELYTNNFRIYTGTLSYMETNSDVLPFLSYGGFVGLIFNERNSTIEDGTNLNTRIIEDVVRDSRTNFAPELGANLAFGVEYFISKNISLVAQTGVELSYTFTNDTVDDKNEQYQNNQPFSLIRQKFETKRHTVFFNNTGVLFGLSAYF